MRVIQFELPDEGRRVGIVRDEVVYDVTSVRQSWHRVVDVFHSVEQTRLAFEAALADALAENPREFDYARLLAATPDRGTPFLHPPLDAEDPHYVLITGTGLTHTGSMKSRDSMHSASAKSDSPVTDSAKMFQMGIDGGKPQEGQRGVAPEWFYKGNGTNLRGHRWTLELPDFAPDGGEEAELVGCYIIDSSGVPRRLGFALGNEWSDHATERVNYLYLAPSKLRQCAVGPELWTEFEFQELQLRCEVLRRGETIYDSGRLLTGQRHMCHSLANCEDHHFKYPQHRVPGDIHLHFFGTSKLSYGARDWVYQDGDEIRIVPERGTALVNTVTSDNTGMRLWNAG